MTETELRKIKDLVEWAADHLAYDLSPHENCGPSCAQWAVFHPLLIEAREALDILEREINAQ